jgi:hypothetical protein
MTISSGSANTITSVSYGATQGSAVGLSFLKYVASAGTGPGGLSLYGLVGGTVPTGANTVYVVASDAGNHNAGSVSVSGAASLGTPVSAVAATSVTSVAVVVNATTTGGLVVAAACFGGGAGSGTFAGTNSVSVKWQHNGSISTAADNGVEGAVVSTGAGANQTVGFSSNVSDNWGIVAVEILPAAAVAGGKGQTVQQAVKRASLW